MTMQFTNIVKAQITQSLIKTLFERAGYRVVRLGVEELFVEVTHLDETQYKQLNLPLGLRFLPDLLVADHDLNHAFLLEVKFRKDFNEASMASLYFELMRQREFWPDSYAIILIANPFVKDGRFHQDYIRVILPTQTEALNPLGELSRKEDNVYRYMYEAGGCEQLWSCLTMLTTFNRFSKGSQVAVNSANADLITTTIKDLRKL